MSSLLAAARFGDIASRNRIVMAPMTRDRAGPEDEPTELMAEYYRQRAGAGLIVTEGTQPSPDGKGYWRTPGIHSEAQVEGWRRIAEAVHAEGAAIVMQLMHCGRASVQANKAATAETVAPSALRSAAKIPGPDGVPQEPDVPRALATDEIAHVIGEYVEAALNARRAGLDGAELHCASGYLPMQFLSSNSNLRTDRYGGSVENRIRFVVETLAAMAKAIGPARVGFRICPGHQINGMNDADPEETYTTLLRAIEPMGLAYLHLIHLPLAAFNPLALVRANWTGPIILNNSLSFEEADRLVAEGEVDAVSFGRHFVSNPDLVERYRKAHPLAKLNRETLYTGLGDDRTGYTDYPAFSG
jgi:NADH:flavin oxidoreductases, Old Yellow Enzyme family